MNISDLRKRGTYISVDVLKTLTDLGIPFCESGRDYKVRCVSGVHADNNPSLRIDQESGVFRCPVCDYKGNLPQFVAKITGKTPDEVYRQLAEDPHAFVDEHTVAWKLRYKTRSCNNSVRAIRLSPSFLPIKENHRMFWEYLIVDRKLSWDLIRYFDIRCCLVGYYNYRVIIPVIFNKKLVSFVARDILQEKDRFEREPDAEYKKYLFPSGSKMGGILFNYDNLNYQDVLYLVEGVFDVFSLWSQGYKNSTCVFGKHISNDQAKMLRRFRNIYVISDQDEKRKSEKDKIVTLMDLAIETIGADCNLKHVVLPQGMDPGKCHDIKKYIDMAAEFRPNPKYCLSIDYTFRKK